MRRWNDDRGPRDGRDHDERLDEVGRRLDRTWDRIDDTRGRLQDTRERLHRVGDRVRDFGPPEAEDYYRDRERRRDDRPEDIHLERWPGPREWNMRRGGDWRGPDPRDFDMPPRRRR